MLIARRSSVLALVFALGSACAESVPSDGADTDSSDTKASPPFLCSGDPDACGIEGGQTGSGGAPAPYICSEAPDECGQQLRGALFENVGTLGDRPDWVRSGCFAASSLDATLPSDTNVCRCQYTFPAPGGDYLEYAPTGEGPLPLGHAYYDVGKVAARGAATGAVGDTCEVRRKYVTDSVCLLDGAEFAGCSLAEPTSCVDTCEQLRSRDAAEAAARLSEAELLGASCGEEACEEDLCHGAFRIGERCYSAHLDRWQFSLGEMSCDLSLDSLQSAQLSPDTVAACPDSATQPPLCLEGEPSVVVSDPEFEIRGMAVDATSIYWYTQGWDVEIYRQPKAGGPAEKVADVVGDVQRLTSDSSRLYWQNGSAIFSVPLDGGTDPLLLAADANVPDAWAVRGSMVYYLSDRDSVDWTGNYLFRSWVTTIESDDEIPTIELRSVASSGGDPALLTSERASVAQLAADATGIYWMQLPLWSSQGGSQLMFPAIRKYAFSDQSVTTFANTARGSSLLTAGGRVLWTGNDSGWSSLPDGSDLAPLGSSPGPITSDGIRVYWASTPGGGNIVSVPVSGGQPELSPCVTFAPASLLADESGIYSLSQHGDLITRLPRPTAP